MGRRQASRYEEEGEASARGDSPRRQRPLAYEVAPLRKKAAFGCEVIDQQLSRPGKLHKGAGAVASKGQGIQGVDETHEEALGASGRCRRLTGVGACEWAYTSYR